MAEVVGAVVVTCPSCQVQGIVRMWGCGCQGADYPNHPFECKQARPYFDKFIRYCQKIDTHGANPPDPLEPVLQSPLPLGEG